MSFRGTEDPSELSTPLVLRREIPWETYLTARLISDKDLQLVKRYDKAPRDTQARILKEAGPEQVEAFLSVLRNVTKEETVQYVLALLDDLLTEDSSLASLFFQKSKVHDKRTDPFSIFLRLLQRTDWFTQEKACRALTAVLEAQLKAGQAELVNGASGGDQPSSSSSRSTDQVEGTLATFVDWLCSQLRRPSHPSRSVLAAVAALSHLLKVRSVRILFLRSGGVQLLGPLLKNPGGPAVNIQLLYEAALCMWQLTFLPQAAEAIASSKNVSYLVELARVAPKEKVLRVSLNALSNLLLSGLDDVGADLVEAGLPKVVAQRKQQSWEDEDVKTVLDMLEEKLTENIKLLSSFEKYKREVLSGSMEWTPMHTSDQFWRDNVASFEDKDFQILRVLLKLLESSRDPKTLAVGCNDVGFFIANHPIGRQIVSDLRGKELVMRLMMHPEPSVQKQALLCVQKVMLARDKLEFLNSQNEA